MINSKMLNSADRRFLRDRWSKWSACSLYDLVVAYGDTIAVACGNWILSADLDSRFLERLIRERLRKEGLYET